MKKLMEYKTHIESELLPHDKFTKEVLHETIKKILNSQQETI